MSSPIEAAIKQICEEKGLAYESVVDAISAALAAAYRKDFGDKNMNVEVEFDPASGVTRAFDIKVVVEDVAPEALELAEIERRARMEAIVEKIRQARARGEVVESISIDDDGLPRFNPKTDIMLGEARVLKMSAQVGDVLRTELPVAGEFGRMAAMTAKQVITQKLREAEREIVFSEFKEQEGKVIVGTVQRREGRVVLVDIGRTTGILRAEDQVSSERYNSGERIKVFVKQVSLTTRGPEILLSRASEELVRKLFEVEIPEVGEGAVKINALAREAGSRSKVAVSSSDDAIDPIGACIGQRGTRIQTVISELGGEKVDIIEWNADPSKFIPYSLSPAKVKGVALDEATKIATVRVDADQLSLAIGRGGQNVRLASRLTGWKINIVEAGKPAEEVVAEAVPEAVAPAVEAVNEAPAPGSVSVEAPAGTEPAA